MTGSSASIGVEWKTVLEDEHQAINVRRGPGRAIEAGNTTSGKAYGESGQFDTVGLALSGGGIRSAAFCLGATQALAERDLIKRIDYLSTVSGGGYTGAAITAAMSRGEGYPFQGPPGDMSDTEALGHLRDYSNYLIPRGPLSLLRNVAVVLRGLFSNVLLVSPIILLLAALTIWLNPNVDSLGKPFITLPWFDGHFAFTKWLCIIGSAIFILWAICRRFISVKTSEFQGWFPWTASWFLVLLAVVAFLEFQPIVVGWMHQVRVQSGTAIVDGSTLILTLAERLVTFLIPFTAFISLFAKRIGEFLQGSDKTSGIMTKVSRLVGLALVWAAALALPVILWMIYLLFVYWGIPGFGKDIAPNWLWISWYWLDLPVIQGIPAFVTVYGAIGGVIILLSWPFLAPNSNSLHRLYRDRLSDAFLSSKSTNNPKKLKNHDIKLSDINTDKAPYHLINAALNIQGSPEANARGRGADFFMFGKLYSGSKMSGYFKTQVFEKAERVLSLSTVMAISGAAVSSNMGSSSISHMAPTLALLNLRLGYWLRNPARSGWLSGVFGIFYLAKEIISSLGPRDPLLYLTDGGHIDNTGLYELLRRRCGFIIVVDAEADPAMTFGSFVRLQRHARIDLGVRINLHWEKIAKTSLSARSANAKPSQGPHCAIGEIQYSNGGSGILIYVKSSLSGDENAYVTDYARRHPEFPHETTGDQFFSEEQFEAYRALGFHCMHGLVKPEERDKAEISASGAAAWDDPAQHTQRILHRLAGLPEAGTRDRKKGRKI